MKTPIRTHVCLSENRQYNLMSIQVLYPRYGGENYLEPFGEISFQQTVVEDTWYGIRFSVNTDNVKHLELMTKLAKFVKANSDYKTQPDEIKKLIGADEHKHHEGEFISLSKRGQNIYKVVKDGNLYKNIIAVDEAKAQKVLKKLNIANAELEFHSQLNF